MEMKKALNIAVMMIFLWSNLTFGAPLDGSVVAGGASISQQGNLTQITQSSQNAVINWKSFDTNGSEQVNFTQPNAQAIALNRITSGMPTQFAGLLTANGRVWIVNPAGVFFTGTSKIDAAGILATTLDIKNSDFMNGKYHFAIVPGFANTSVINNGEINTIGDNGLVALVAPGVENNGIIRANAGRVVLASGTDLTLDLYGDNLISFAAGSQVNQAPIGSDGKPLSNAVSNNGTIQANNGGQVLLTANAAEKVVQNVVSMNGVIEAKNAVQNGGVIILGENAGQVHVGGAITSNHIKIKSHRTVVDGTINVPSGGVLETSGDYVDINNANLNLGQGASLLLDPTILDIKSSCVGDPNSCITTATITAVLNGNAAFNTVSTADTNILNDLSWTGGASSVLSISSGANININNANITDNNTAGSLNLIADNQGTGIGTVNFIGTGAVNMGGGGVVNFYYNPVTFGSVPSFPQVTVSGGTVFNPYQLISGSNANALSQLNSIRTNSNIGLYYALGVDIDASSTFPAGFTPIRDSGNPFGQFTGKFDGQGHVIKNLYINDGSDTNVGLFSSLSSGAVVSNLGLINANITGYVNSGRVGGIAGGNLGTINNSFVTGKITDASALGMSIGGLVGSNVFAASKINNSYSNAVVISTGTTSFVGGLAGLNGGTINQSYSTGFLSGNNVVGGLVGSGGTANNSFWDTQTTGVSTSAGGTGVTTSSLQASLPAGWNSNIWNTIPGTSYPYLTQFYPTTPRVISGSSSATGGNVVNVVVNGAVSQSIYTGANGYFYNITPNGTIADNANVLVYLSGAGVSANDVFKAPMSGGSAVGLSLVANTVQVGDSLVSKLTNSDLGNAVGGLSGSDILYSYNSPNDNLILNSGVDLVTTPNTTYDLGLKLTASGGGNVTFNGPVTAGQGLNAAVQVNASNIVFASTLDTDSSVNPVNSLITLNGNVVFNGRVGSLIAPSVVTINGHTQINTDELSTAGTFDFEGQTTLGNSVTLLGNTFIFNGDINDSVAGTNSLTLASASTASSTFLRGNIGNTTPINNLTVYGNLILNNNGITSNPISMIATLGDQTYNTGSGFFNNIQFSTTPADFTFSGNNLTFNVPLIGLSASPVVITGLGVINLNANIGADQFGTPIPLSALTVNNNFGFTNLNTGFIETTGDQTYNTTVAVPFGVSPILAGNLMHFINTVDGPGDLTITGNAEFDANVGGFTSLGNLTVSGQTELKNGGVTTSGNQDYQGPVTLSNNTINLQGSLVTFSSASSTINGASDLTVTGNAQFDGNVGGSAPLNSLTVSGSTTTSATAITTSGEQKYSGPVILTNGLFPTSFTGSLITFGSSLDGVNDLTINGDAVFQGSVGASQALSSLAVNGQSTFDSSAVTTYGDQNYAGPVVLNSSVNFSTIFTGTQLIFFDTVQGSGFDLNATAGTIAFNGNVGSLAAPLGNMSLFGYGFIEFNNAINVYANSLTTQNALVDFIGANLIHTTGDQTYNNPVQLTNAVVNFEGANIIFNSALDSFISGPNLASFSNTVSTQFNGAVGSLHPLSGLTMNNSTSIAGMVNTVGDQNYNAGVVLTGDGVLIAPNVTIQGGIFGSGLDLNIQASNVNVSGSVSLNHLLITGTGAANSFALDTGTAQNWVVSGSGAGTMAGIGSFTNIQTLTGGSVSDNFVFQDGAFMTSINGGGGNTILDLSGFFNIHPVSVIMSNLPTASGTAYSALAGNQIDLNSSITAFNHITTVKGNSSGLFQVPNSKAGNIVFNNPITPISSTQFVASGSVTDPINFEDFIFFFPSANNIPTNIPNILDGVNYPQFGLTTGCIGDNCSGADVTIITDAEDNEAFQRTPIGNVGCLYGFAEAVSSTGVARILLPGDPVYADDKVISNSPTCIKSSDNRDSQSCKNNQNQS